MVYPRRLYALFSAASLLAGVTLPASAVRCGTLHNRVREQVFTAHDIKLRCEDVVHAFSVLKIREFSGVQGTWEFLGEAELRYTLREKFGIYPPKEILPLGFVERIPPIGRPMVVVFGLSMPSEHWPVAVLAKVGAGTPMSEMAERLGEGTWFDRVGFHLQEKDGRYPSDGNWLNMDAGGLWQRHRPEPGGVRGCLPCEGWLCPEEPLACFSDFNDNGFEEVHLTDDCGAVLCGTAVLEPRGEDRVELLLNAKVADGDWHERAEGWVLVPRVRCGGRTWCAEDGESLGDPSCKMPLVRLLPRSGGPAVLHDHLQREFFPVRVVLAPRHCPLEKGGEVLVWTDEERFVRYYR